MTMTSLITMMMMVMMMTITMPTTMVMIMMGMLQNIFLRIKRIFLVRKNYFVKFRKNHITCPEQSQVLSKSTYSPSLLYNPRASLVGFPSSSSLNFSFAMLSNNLDK